jgi:uncharacterized protein YlaI
MKLYTVNDEDDPIDPYYCEDCDNDIANYCIDTEQSITYLCKPCLMKLKNEIEKVIK